MDKKKLDIWMKFFLLCDHTKNVLPLTKYFYTQFLLYPQERDVFLEDVQKLLLSEQDPDKARLYARRYMACLSEMFERFSLYQKKCELDDVYFQLIDPEAYQHVLSEVEYTLGKHKEAILTTRDILAQLCEDLGVRCTIKHRTKNTYSVYQKMKRLQTTKVTDIKDLIGFRIIVENNSIDDCYMILTEIHDRYIPEIHSFKDYIRIPKVNGYQSIHTGVYGLWSKPTTQVEIQIKTADMEISSMEGLSNHLAYKMSEKIRGGREVLSMDHHEIVSQEKETIHILTRDMDIISLPVGTRVIDFAYKIHSSIAERLMGAYINDAFSEISTELREGDIVGLVSHPTKKQVSASWLSIPKLQKRSRKQIYAKTR